MLVNCIYFFEAVLLANELVRGCLDRQAGSLHDLDEVVLANGRIHTNGQGELLNGPSCIGWN